MNKKEKITLAGLLHDIGKIVRRADNSGEHSSVGAQFLKQLGFDDEIVSACKYHHAKLLSNANVQNDDISYIVYIADNISSGADRREIDDETSKLFDEHTCLKSIFNLMNNNRNSLGYPDANTKTLSDLIFPTTVCQLSKSTYSQLINKAQSLLGDKFLQSSENSYIELFESIANYVPSCTSCKDSNDISLYDHCRLTAGLSTCIYDYLTSKNIEDYKNSLLIEEKNFMNEKAFLLAEYDISGIQKFIYTIEQEDALKQLRARSAYLDITNEFLTDNILSELELSKANLVYNGGGHSYILLPNTEYARTKFKEIISKQNQWFLNNFRETLFISCSLVECSANELSNKNIDGEFSKINTFGNIFKKLSEESSIAKLKRYSAQEIINLNSLNIAEHERECSLCGNSKSLKDNRCELCNSMTALGKKIIQENRYFIFTKEKIPNGENVPFYSHKYNEAFLQIVTEEQVIQMLKLESAILFYGKNSLNMGKNYAGKIFFGEYYAKKDDKPMNFDDFEQESKGIKRLALFRADVDNLGNLFKCGFKRDNSFQYETLSRSATLSRYLSKFFKLHINEIFSDKYKKYSTLKLFEEDKNQRKISIIYSGGDDICLVGSYDDVIEAAVDLKNAFYKYCDNTMTISGGIGIYRSGYPISQMAVEVGELESLSKQQEGKNSITFFNDSENYSFKWEDFENNVVKDKLRFIQNYFSETKISRIAGGKSFIYKILDMIRNNDRVKLVYTLARLLDNETITNDRSFINKLYEWSKNKKEMKELTTALTLYVYSIRED